MTGPQGPRGYTGAPGTPGQAGPQGQPGPKGDTGYADAFVPDSASITAVGQAYVDADGYLEVCTSLDPIAFVKGALVKGPKGDKGEAGEQGEPGLTTAVEVNGQVYTVDDAGKITLPNYPEEVVWGNIKGTLSNQTDLKTALNAKQNVISDLADIREGAALGKTALQDDVMSILVTKNTDQTITGKKTFNGVVAFGDNNGEGGSIHGDVFPQPDLNEPSITIDSSTNENYHYKSYISLKSSKSDYESGLGPTVFFQGDLNPVGGNKFDIGSYNNQIKDLYISGKLISGPTKISVAVADIPSKSEIPTKTSQLTNDSNFVTSDSLATVATSGSYNDLINKPTIKNVSGVNDGTNWTSLTIGSETYGLGGGGGSETSIEVNGQLYNADAEGKITLPNYPTLPDHIVNLVNGKDGAVTLYAKDINAENNNTIQANLDRLDSNINRVEASIPDTSQFITSTELNNAIQTKQDILVNSKDTIVDANKVTTVYGGGYTDVEKRLYHNCPKLETYNTKYNNYTGTNTSDITWMNEKLELNSEYPMILRLFVDESNFQDYEGTWTVSSNYKSDGTMNIPGLGISGVRMYTNSKSMFVYLTKEQTNNAVAVQISISAETYTEQIVNPIDPKWMPETGLVKSVNGLEGYVTLSANEIAANNGASMQSNLERIDAEISRVEGEIPSIAGLATETYVSEQLATKQDVISDLATIRSGSEAGATAVQPAALSEYAKTSEVATAVSTAISNQTKETWTFTLSDGSTVTKSVVLGA